MAALVIAALVHAVEPAVAAPAGDDAQTTPAELAGHSFLFSAGPVPLPGVPPVVGLRFVLDSTHAKHLTYTQVAGPTNFGLRCQNETIHVTRIDHGIFFVRWVEASGIAVSHVENLRSHETVVSSVIPTTLTGQALPLAVSFSGSLRPYHGKPQPICPNNGSGA